MDLIQKKCQACEGGTKPLRPDLIEDLKKQINPGWQVVDGKKIQREFKFKNFREAMVFINKIADLAESEGHHPDINLHGWNKVTLSLSTHAIGGLSENDFILAAKIDRA